MIEMDEKVAGLPAADAAANESSLSSPCLFQSTRFKSTSYECQLAAADIKKKKTKKNKPVDS